MKILVAIDSFKGCLSSRAAGEACRRGVLKAAPRAECRVFAIGDGGEGTVDALAGIEGMSERTATVEGPLGEPVVASYLVSADGSTAIMEMIAAAGLTLVPSAKRNPWHASTFGVGQMVAHAVAAGCRHIVLGVGGSATCDGGAGFLQALGYRLVDALANTVGMRGGKAMETVCRIDASGVPSALPGVDFTLMCDVDNPFSGPQGAAMVFAPQKGADAAMARALDDGLRRMAGAFAASGYRDISRAPGAGAAGGLAGALMAVLGAEVVSGIDAVLGMTGFDGALAGASLVITGEGRIDEQSLRGKAPAGVLAASRRRGVPVVALCGGLSGADALLEAGFLAVLPIQTGAVTLVEAMSPEYTAENIERTACMAMRLFACKGRD